MKDRQKRYGKHPEAAAERVRKKTHQKGRIKKGEIEA